MNPTAAHLKRIQEKLQQLLKTHTVLQKENIRLKQELTQSTTALAHQQQHVEELKQQVDILKLGAGEMNDEDKKVFEKKLNGYIREIDKCIALLSK